MKHDSHNELQLAVTSGLFAQRAANSAAARGEWGAMARADLAASQADIARGLERLLALTQRAEITSHDQPL